MPKTTADYVQMLKDKYHLSSNYKVAVMLEKTDTNVANWTKGRTTFDDETALIIAEKLEIDPAIIITSCQIERAEKQGKKGAAAVYRRILENLEKAATTGIAAAVTFTVLADFFPY